MKPKRAATRQPSSSGESVTDHQQELSRSQPLNLSQVGTYSQYWAYCSIKSMFTNLPSLFFFRPLSPRPKNQPAACLPCVDSKPTHQPPLITVSRRRPHSPATPACTPTPPLEPSAPPPTWSICSSRVPPPPYTSHPLVTMQPVLSQRTL